MDQKSTPSLRVLFTNTMMQERSGSELVVFETARYLQKSGHRPYVFAPLVGELAVQLARLGVPVVSDIRSLQFVPDVIHGQHHLASMIAAMHFPSVPVVSFCHGWLPWVEKPIAAPNVVSYVAVSELTRDRVLTTKGTGGRPVHVVRNWFNAAFVHRRAQFRPVARALIYNNTVGLNSPIYRACAEACGSIGLSLDLVGREVGRISSEPQNLLPNYDLVFAVGRSAIEAMACGCAVILADNNGIFGLVTPQNFNKCQSANFGLALLDRSQIDVDFISREVERVNLEDISTVSNRVRKEHSSVTAFSMLEAIYFDATVRFCSSAMDVDHSAFAAMVDYLSDFATLVHSIERNRLPQILEKQRKQVAN